MATMSANSEDEAYYRLSLGDAVPARFRGGALTIGNFDGVHLGHAALVRKLVEQARTVSGPAIVLSFDPHPLELLAPEKFMPVLTTPGDRAGLLRSLGVDAVIYMQTTAELLQLTPAEFFRRVMHDGFAARAIVEGFNFRFGRDRAGDNELMAEMCREHGIQFTLVPPFTLDGRPVSSSRVRTALAAGDVREAARLLDRRYRVRGIVGTGQRRGRTIGFPTANLDRVVVLPPADGVYVVRALLDGQWRAGAANIGPNPTFGENIRKIEVHLLDFDGDLYGRKLEIEFLDRLRETQRFADAESLSRQLQYDIAAVRSVAESIDLKSRVQAILKEQVAPALELDGSRIEVIDVSGGVVQLRLNGACTGCPATIMTLVHGLEHELRQLIPEIEYLEALP